MQRDGWRAQAPGVLSPLREGPGLLPLVIKGRLRQRGACGLQNKGDCTWGLSEALSWGLPEIQEKAPPLWTFPLRAPSLLTQTSVPASLGQLHSQKGGTGPLLCASVVGRLWEVS